MAFETVGNSGHLPLSAQGKSRLSSVFNFLHWGCIWEAIPSANFVIQAHFPLVCSGSVLHVVTNCFTACGKWPLGWGVLRWPQPLRGAALLVSSLVSPQVSRHSSPLTSSHPFPSPHPLPTALIPKLHHLYPHPLSIAVIPKLERACIRIIWTVY